jgi:hypothetical protein
MAHMYVVHALMESNRPINGTPIPKSDRSKENRDANNRNQAE